MNLTPSGVLSIIFILYAIISLLNKQLLPLYIGMKKITKDDSESIFYGVISFCFIMGLGLIYGF